MDELAGILGTFTARSPPFTDNYFRQTGKLMNFELIEIKNQDP